KVPGESETNIIDAAALALERLRSAKDQARKVLILLSDGEHNQQPASDWPLEKVVKVASALRVPIYAIDAAGTGISQGEPGQPSPSLENRETAVQTLRQLAQGTGGQYFRADNTEALLKVYQVIDRKERVPIESYQFRRH